MSGGEGDPDSKAAKGARVELQSASQCGKKGVVGRQHNKVQRAVRSSPHSAASQS